jgi:hypothetical protein
MLKHSFLSISINSIIQNLIVKPIQEKASSNEMDLIGLLIKKGFDIATLNEVFSRKELSYTLEELAVDSIIEKLLKQYTDQDLVIKIRDGEKKSLKRIIIKNNSK